MGYVLVDLTAVYPYGLTVCPICHTPSDIQASQQEALNTGMAFAHCGATVLQVVGCHTHNCNGIFVFRSIADDPAIDMRNMLLMPSSHQSVNWIEQWEFCLYYKNWNKKLQFEYWPAWDEDHVSKEQYLKYLEQHTDYIQTDLNVNKNTDRIVQVDENVFIQKLFDEEKQRFVIPKRLFPNNKFYHSLFQYISPHLLTDSNPYNAWRFSSDKDTIQKRNAFLYLLKHLTGRNIYLRIRKKLTEHDVVYDIKALTQEVTTQLYSKTYLGCNDFETIKEGVISNDHSILKALFSNKFNSIYHPICTDHFLSKYRSELSSWPETAKKGTALFIDAPMGLGKTYSIVEGLASRPDKSAIIFMPTKRLCQDLRDQLALKISDYAQRPPKYSDKVPYDEHSELELDEYGMPVKRFKESYYLKRGVYLYDGINSKECPNYNEIIERYQSGDYQKKDICTKCKIVKCRFRKHRENIKKYRIIITTHFMYDFFYHNTSYRRWEIYGDNGKVIENRLRDYFIVDEDFILSNCYQPISLSEDGLINFVSTLTNFFRDIDINGDIQVDRELFQKTDLIIGLALKTKENSVIPPIDPFFRYPSNIKNLWNGAQKEIEEFIPDEIFFTPKTFSSVSYVGDYLTIIENAIRNGFVVQAFKQNSKTILIPNPKQYSIGKDTYPAHVFFDGTRMDNKYIKNRLKGVEIKTKKINIDKPLWDLKAFQNTNTDLPKKKSLANKKNVEDVLHRILQKHGRFEKYFILTNKQLKINVEEFLNEQYPYHYCVIEYFGNLRGLNSARQCNVGIVLGSLILPDTVDVSLAYDFIYSKFHSLPPYPMKIFGNLWNWRGSMGTRQYKDDFKPVKDFSEMYRYAEYRQALARTRYLSHPVTFYIFSKDEVSTYEPFIDKVETDQYSSDIFPPKPRRSDSKDEEIEKNVLDWLINRKYSSVTATILHTEYEVRRQTAGALLKRMCSDNKLQLVENFKKRYEPTIAWRQKVDMLY